MSLEAVGGLRILGFCDHLPFESSGGSERVAWELYLRMAAAGAAVTLIAATAEAAERVDEMERVRVVSVPATRLRRWLRAEVTFAPRLFRRAFAEAASVRPDVLHANSLHFQSSVAAALVAGRRALPLVTTVHLASVGHLPPPLRAVTTAYEHTIGRYILGRSARAIAVSPSVATHVRALGMRAEQVVTVPNGVDHERFNPERREPRPVPHVVMVGRLIPNKGPELFVEALAALRARGTAFTAALVGDGPQRPALERSVRERGLAGQVTFTGHVADVAAELRRADVLARPSLTEGMPLAVLEAMASGVCVVASEVEGTTDVVEHGTTGLLFPPRSLAGLVAALERVLESPAERGRLAAAGQRASLAYSWETAAAATAAVLTDVARGATSAA